LFSSATAIAPSAGALEATLEEAEVKRTIAANAERVVAATDGSKLGIRSAAVALDWDRIDLLVTNLDPADP
jgi:DeoR family fructose operon transcriptional repressor